MPQSNGILKIMTVLAVVLGGFVVLRACKDDEAPAAVSLEQATQEPNLVAEQGLAELGTSAISLDEQQKLDVTADTPQETLNTLNAGYKDLLSEVRDLRKENSELTRKNAEFKAMEESIEQRIANKLEQKHVDEKAAIEERNAQLTRQTAETNQLLAEIKSKVAGMRSKGGEIIKSTGLTNTSSIGGDIPVGLGIGVEGYATPADSDNVVWHHPLDARETKEGGYKFPSLSNTGAAVSGSLTKVSERINQAGEAMAKPIPTYTINRDATLMGSVSMTALLGRIPIGSTVQDPYPFKILVGRENLAANGVMIPDNITGMVMSGVATGDWTLSCVSGKIFSATFVYQDGTIRSFPSAEGNTSGAGGGGKKQTEQIGWLSDRFGIPCITGERKTNAAQYLTQRVGLSAAKGFADARAAKETTTNSGPFGNSSAVTGNPLAFARNIAIGDGLKEVGDWLDQRQSSSFDAVFVPAGTEVAVHIDVEIPIDYNQNGRKVKHNARLDITSRHPVLD